MTNPEVLVIGKYKYEKFLGLGAFGLVSLFSDSKTTYTSGNKNLVKLLETHEIFEDRYFMFIVLEYCDGGDYELYLQNKRSLTEITVKYFSQQLVNGLRTLQNVRITHRDLKPGNIFLASQHRPTQNILETDYHRIVLKIGDFGTCKQLLTGRKTNTYACGTFPYMAPEAFESETSETNSGATSYTNKADMWSLGLIIFVSLCGLGEVSSFDSTGIPLTFDPMINPSKLRAFQEKVEQKVNDLTSDIASQSLISLLTNLVQRNAEKRPTFVELEAHPFFMFPEPEEKYMVKVNHNHHSNHDPKDYRQLAAIYSGAIADENRIPHRWDAFGHTGKFKVVQAFYRWKIVFHGTITCEGVGIWKKENSKSCREAFLEAFQQYMVHLCKNNLIVIDQMIMALNEQHDLGQSDKNDTISKLRS